MELSALSESVWEHLKKLTQYPDRHVGGTGNHAATEYFAGLIAEMGCDVSVTEFDCVEWEYGEAQIQVGPERIAALVGPYSLSCDVSAPLIAVETLEGLESAEMRDSVVLLHGEIAKHQVMPKNFRFYNPEEHKRIIRALEEGRPAAVVAATGKDPEMVGSQYPFPLFEDGDLDIPNAYMKDVDAARLLEHAHGEVALSIDSTRVPTTAQHVIATRTTDSPRRVVVSAHIDSRKDSPGAMDNAVGVASLLALAALLEEDPPEATVEFVPFNGEDNYANPGELMWLAENEGSTGDIVLAINIDDLGQHGTENHVSFYDCPDRIESLVRSLMDVHPDTLEGPQWFQGDHMVFKMSGIPAIALASSDIEGFMAKYAHTERDTIELVDAELVAKAAFFMSELIRAL